MENFIFCPVLRAEFETSVVSVQDFPALPIAYNWNLWSYKEILSMAPSEIC